MTARQLHPFLRPIAWAPAALEEAGVPAATVRTWLADGPRATAECPRLSLTGRKRGAATTRYVWGLDLRTLADGRAARP